MKVLPKEFLSIGDVALFLNEHGYQYNVMSEDELNRLTQDIFDLIKQKRITPVFYYCGYVEVKKEQYLEEDGIFVLIDQFTHYLDGYFKLNDEQILIIFDDKFTVHIQNAEVETFWFKETGYKPITTNSRFTKRGEDIDEFTISITIQSPVGDEQIAFEDVRYPRIELEKLVGIKNKQIINDQMVNDEPTHHKSVSSMAALIATLIKMAEYDKEDLRDPYGELNRIIQAQSNNLEISIQKDFIGKWLKKADELL